MNVKKPESDGRDLLGGVREATVFVERPDDVLHDVEELHANLRLDHVEVLVALGLAERLTVVGGQQHRDVVSVDLTAHGQQPRLKKEADGTVRVR